MACVDDSGGELEDLPIRGEEKHAEEIMRAHGPLSGRSTSGTSGGPLSGRSSSAGGPPLDR